MSDVSQLVKAVFFDIGGVVVKSPLIAIHAYEREKGHSGAWQRFERDELELYPFYKAFGEELSDTARGNEYYKEWCRSRNVEVPHLPGSVTIDGRELFGRMMRSAEFDPHIVTAIHELRASGRFRIVALTNNYSAQYDRIRSMKASTAKALFDPDAELEFLGWGPWTGGPAGPKVRELFDDFVDSSVVGKPELAIYEFVCKSNNVKPSEVVFLDDLGLNLRTAKELGMRTIHVPIGQSRQAVAKLEELLKIPLSDSDGHESERKSKL